MNTKFKGSGRTHRLLCEAIAQAQQGRYVFVIGANHEHVNGLRLRCLDLIESKVKPERRDKIYVHVPLLFGAGAEQGSITFASQALVSFDWEEMRVRGSHPSCVVLVDHYAIEEKFANLLAMLHRFDPVSILEAPARDAVPPSERMIRS